MGAELPGGESLDWVFKTIAENNGPEGVEAAAKLIQTANDREMRTEVVKRITEYQKAEDSIKMHEASEELIAYIKKQFSLILIQGFRMGQGYQQKISHEAFKDVLAGATAQYEKDLASKEKESEEKTEEGENEKESGPKSEK